jgi:hypothetical protein
MSDPSAPAQTGPNRTTPSGEPDATAPRNVAGAATRRSGPGSEPPLGPLALLSTILAVASVGTSAALGGTVPSPFAALESIGRYFTQQPDAVLAASVLSFASLVPLTIVVGVLGARLRLLGITRGGAALTHVAGGAAVALSALSALVLWVLSRPEVRDQPGVVRALHDVAFAVGGAGFAVFLGAMILGITAPARTTGILPRPVCVIGFLLAAVAATTILGLLWPSLTVLLPVARFGGLAWLTYIGFTLPQSRPRRGGETSGTQRP